MIKAFVRAGADYVDLYLYWLTRSLGEAAPRAHGRLLDVGCGDKRFERVFAPHVSSYTGLEHATVFASTEASSRGSAPDVLYDGKTIPFDARSFDTVISTEVLEHTPEPAALVAEMARVLAPGGTMILTTPFSMRLHGEPYDYYRFTPHGLAVLVERAGLRVVSHRAFGGLWSVVGHKVNSYLAIRLARLQSLGQVIGKAGHEAPDLERPRLWSIPIVAPTMVGVATLARLLDRVAPDPTEALGYLVIAQSRAGG